MMRLLTIVAVVFLSVVSTANAATSPITKTACTQTIGYKSLDEVKADLLVKAKRDAVSELFGELIRASTAVKNFVITSDSVTASSLGLVRVQGDVDYYNGKNLGDVCVTIKAFIAPEDLKQFEPVKVTKRHCVNDSSLTAPELINYGKKEVIVQALLDFDGSLSEIDRNQLVRLMQRVTYLASDVNEGGAFCAEIEGYVVPIELKAARDTIADIAKSKESPQAVGTPKVPSADQSGLPIADTFDVGPGDFWIQEGGDWNMQNEQLVNNNGQGILWLGKRDWTDVSVEVDIGGSYCGGRTAQILVRMQNPSNYVSFVAIGCDNEALYLVKDSKVVKKLVHTWGQRGKVRVEAVGKIYRIYLDGKIVGTASDSTYLSGSVGLILSQGVVADNFVVRAYKP